MALKGNNDIQLAYIPAYKNRYEVSIIDTTTGVDLLHGEYAKFGATDVSFGDESLTFVRNPATTRFTLKEGAYKRSDTLTITWRESDMYKVKAIHRDWVSSFYNASTDKYISAKTPLEAKARYRTIQVVVPSTAGDGKATRFSFTCLPNNIGNLSLAWGPSASLTTYSINYYVEDWKMEEVNDEFF